MNLICMQHFNVTSRMVKSGAHRDTFKSNLMTTLDDFTTTDHSEILIDDGFK